MKIGIDCRFWGIEHAGLGRYTQNLVLNLLKFDKKNHYFLFFRKGRGREVKETKNIEKIFFDIPHYSIKEQLLFPKTITRYNLDLFHFPHFNVPILLRQIPFIVTIHDLIKHFFKGKTVTTRNMLTYWMKHTGYRLVINKAIKKAQKIIVPSHFVKDQVSSHYPDTEYKIKVIYEGVDEKLKTKNQKPKTHIKNLKISKRYKIKTPYFIYVGNVYPFKNVPFLLKAIKQFKDIQLVIVCSRSVFWERLKKEVKELELEKQVIMPGQVSDKSLAGLLKGATAFVTASLMEGFGLPGLEALSVSCPVLAAKAGSLPEIYGNAVSYFDPNNVDELIEKMKKVLSLSRKQKKRLIEKGKEQTEKYSWQKTAKETLRVYNNTA